MRSSRVVFVVHLWLLFCSVSLVATSGFESLGNFLDVLPSSQIIVGGSRLIGLKWALATRLLARLGVISSKDEAGNLLLGENSTKDGLVPAMVTTTTVSPSETSNYTHYGLSRIYKYLGLVRADENYAKDTTATSTTSRPAEDESQGQEYFPIPGLKIGFDNSTGKYSLLSMDEYYPSVMLPSNYANYPDYKKNLTASQRATSNYSNFSSPGNRSFLFYPLYPTEVTSNNLAEPGYITITNQSQLVGLANGSMSFISEDDFTFDGYVSDDLKTSQSAIESSTSSSSAAVSSTTSSTATSPPQVSDSNDWTSFFYAANDTGNATVDLSFDVPLGRKLRRRKRLDENLLNIYFDFIYALDDEDCFAKVLCEIGANRTSYGKFGVDFNNLMERISYSSLKNASAAQHYYDQYDIGKERGSNGCEYVGECSQNMAQIVASVPMTP